MSDHVDDRLLSAFVAGELGEHTAVLVARHLDDCPACAARAAQADPLARVFASVDDPPVPADLVDAVIAASTPARPAAPSTELGLAALLLSAAAGLAWTAGGTFDGWHELRVALRGLAAAGAHTAAVPDVLPTLLVLGLASATAARALSGRGRRIDG